VEIREVRPEEYVAAGRVTLEAWEEFYGIEALGSYAERLRDIGARVRGAVVLVALEEGDVVGTATYVPGPSSPYSEQLRAGEAGLRMLSVAPERKRQGIGRALSLACIDRARAEGKTALVLHADQIMSASQRLYESLGFHRDPSRDFAPDRQTSLLCYALTL
jgi:GNAT superfamily N-acetyltransferase